MAKQNETWRWARIARGAAWVAALALLLLGGHRVRAASGDQDAEELGHRGQNPNPALFRPESHPFGRAMDTWAEDWWGWELSIPAANNPILTADFDCGTNQSGPVFFVPPVAVGTQNLTRSCTVPHGKALAVSLSTVLNDFPCPDPTFKPAPGQSLFDFLLAGAVAGNADIAEIDVTLDGEPLNDILDYHFASDRLFFFKGDTSLQPVLDSCITGQFQPAAVDAYLIVFKPLRPGHHTITRRVVTTKGLVTGPTITELEVLPERGHEH